METPKEKMDLKTNDGVEIKIGMSVWYEGAVINDLDKDLKLELMELEINQIEPDFDSKHNMHFYTIHSFNKDQTMQSMDCGWDCHPNCRVFYEGDELFSTRESLIRALIMECASNIASEYDYIEILKVKKYDLEDLLAKVILKQELED